MTQRLPLLKAADMSAATSSPVHTIFVRRVSDNRCGIFTDAQRQYLETYYLNNDYPDGNKIKAIWKTLQEKFDGKFKQEQIKNWFNRTRYRWHKEENGSATFQPTKKRKMEK